MDSLAIEEDEIYFWICVGVCLSGCMGILGRINGDIILYHTFSH